MTKFDKPESYWQELTMFRSQHQDDCVSSKPCNFNNSTSFLEHEQNDLFRSAGDDNYEEDGNSHKCIHSFTINERLFPVPVYKDKNGRSLCPVCKSVRRDESSNYAPQFCKISIPKSRIIDGSPLLSSSTKFELINKRKLNAPEEDTLSLAEVRLFKELK
jgi:hypothetical protein